MRLSLTQTVLVGNAVLVGGLLAVAWRHRSTDTVRIFGLYQAVALVWLSLTAVGLALPAGPLRLRLWGLEVGTSLVATGLWLVFILSYTGRERWLTSRRCGLALVPLVAGAGAYYLRPEWAPMVGKLNQASLPAGTVVQASIGSVGAVLAAYIYLVVAAGVVLVVRTVVTRDRMFAGPAVAFVLGSFVTLVGSALTVFGVPAEGYPFTPVALGGQSLLWGYAVFRQRFLDVVPGVARLGERSVFDELDDAVVIVSDDGTVLRANPRARALFDDIPGGSVHRVLDRMDVGAVADLPTRFRHGGRTYQATASPMTNWRGEEIGRALVCRDVTRLARRQQRLQVLNRVLRHNVRNDMDVVLAVGSRLRDADDEDLERMGGMLRRTAEGLTDISQQALEVDRTLEVAAGTERVTLPALIDDIVGPLAADHPPATVTTSVDVDRVEADPELLSLVLGEAVENALTHAGDAPTVRVAAVRTGDRVEISVADDGPGIPDTEVDPVTAGEETDLEHTTGLGLWSIQWGTRALGGDVRFATTGDGSTVTVELPAAASVEPAASDGDESEGGPESGAESETVPAQTRTGPPTG